MLVLLGAGASKPNLPTSAELVDKVFALLDASFAGDRPIDKLWQAIRPTAGKVGEVGNIEDVYEAISTLSYQDSDPTRHWIEGFTTFDFYTDDEQGRTELQRDAEAILHFIEQDVLQILSGASPGAPLDHFLPLLQADLLGIANLNYDTLVETAGRELGVAVSTGAEEWDGGFRWCFREGALPLLKIHGSFTWRASKSLDGGGGGVPNIGLYEMTALDEPAPNRRVDSTLIFGGQAKLTPHGPFPALMRQFTDWLDQADVLVGAGFGFADEHIVGAIRRWASLDANRKMIIVDPHPRKTGPFVGDTYGGLLFAMWEGYRDPVGGVPGYAATVGPNRIDFLEEGVVVGLPALFEQDPGDQPER